MDSESIDTGFDLLVMCGSAGQTSHSMLSGYPVLGT